jgi:hypothetical protein
MMANTNKHGCHKRMVSFYFEYMLREKTRLTKIFPADN